MFIYIFSKYLECLLWPGPFLDVKDRAMNLKMYDHVYVWPSFRIKVGLGGKFSIDVWRLVGKLL